MTKSKQTKTEKAATPKQTATVRKAVGNVLGLLKQAALAGVEVSGEMRELGEKRKGAYTLYVEAAIEAKTAEVLATASDSLFATIRKTGQIDGRSLGCKQTKDGQFIIPSAIMSAKSVMISALVNKVDLTGEDGPRSFTDIRKEVQSINAADRVAKLEGVAKTRHEFQTVTLVELADLVAKEENNDDLKDLMARVSDAMRDYGFVETPTREVNPAATDAVAEMVAEADDVGTEAARTVARRPAPRNRRQTEHRAAA